MQETGLKGFQKAIFYAGFTVFASPLSVSGLFYILYFLRSELLALVYLSFYTGSVKGNVRASIPTPSFAFY